MSTGQHIDYDALVRDAVQEAKRNVVRAVLAQVAKSGLVGGHHFLIAFSTQASGVIISKRLKEKYPVEMTIVLQHRFWDLEVGEDRFEVKLTFDSIPERLAVPYTALKAFYDPSVPYMLPFDEAEPVLEPSAAAGDLRAPQATTGPARPRGSAARPQRSDAPERGDGRRDKPAGRRPTGVDKTELEEVGELRPPPGRSKERPTVVGAAAEPTTARNPDATREPPRPEAAQGDTPAPATEDAPPASPNSGNVVSITEFRKDRNKK